MSVMWQWFSLAEISAPQWHEVAAARQAVFVVEQRCPYPDLDEKDHVSAHLVGRDEAGNVLAYLRLVPPGLKFDEPSLGRIMTTAAARGKGLGRPLVLEGLAEHQRRYPGLANAISAQAHLNELYASLGFTAFGEIYLEDEIPHQNMRWNPPR